MERLTVKSDILDEYRLNEITVDDCQKAINQLGKYKDASENGQFLRIEVKIGDKASVIDKDYETDKMKVYDGIWERVCYVQSKDGSYSIHGEVSYDVYDFFYNDGRTMRHVMYVGQESTKVGDRVFIGENAHEQAEEKLKKLIS